jgi:hypothetical protein
MNAYARQELGGGRNRKRKQPPTSATYAGGMGEEASFPRRIFDGKRRDHLLAPFECNLCVFRKLKRQNPIPGSHQDDLLSECIRRANLNAFGRRVVLSNCNKVAFALKMIAAVGLLGPCKADGPLPEEDHCGYEVAIEMHLHSCRGGSYSDTYTQFDTI